MISTVGKAFLSNPRKEVKTTVYEKEVESGPSKPLSNIITKELSKNNSLKTTNK